MTVVGCLANYFVMIPFYIKIYNLSIEAIVGITNGVGNTLVKDMTTLIVFVFVPFNLLKGLVVSFIVALIYKRISPFLHKGYLSEHKIESQKP